MKIETYTAVIGKPGQQFVDKAKGNEIRVQTNEDGERISVQFNCPCGNNKCYINLPITDRKKYKADKSSWTLDIEDDKVTISPSVRDTYRCRSHFYLKGNKVEWLDDSAVK